MKQMLFYSILFSLFFSLKSQTNIGGIINIYTPVVSINCNTITVSNTNGFSTGDRVLIIQMKGATIDSTNSSSFGTVLNLNNCGNYEFATVSSVNGNVVAINNPLLKSYTTTSAVQLVRVPQYTNATVTTPLSCLPWNGSIGGVLVMEVSNQLTLNASIDVSGKGFRGGTACANPDGGCGSGYQNYFYAVSSGFGAEKGEGITMVGISKKGGRGALANGGGGGNKHNSGGGGGGNYTMGGVGGQQANFCASSAIGGKGGRNLDYTLGKIYMGGGGGCSDNNNGVGTFGGNGGGIIIIRANQLNGQTNSIISNGTDVSFISNSIGDGAGGAGAGGTILLDIPNYSTVTSFFANGGHGGDQFTNYPACFGPGGGGGVGVIYFSASSTPAGIQTSTIPGLAGVDTHPNSSCYNTNYGASAGEIGDGVLYNLQIPENTTPLSIDIDLGNDTVLCSGSIVLNAYTSGASYIWSNGSLDSAITVSSPGLFWVTANVGGCEVSDSISISGVSSTLSFLGNDTTLCTDSILLNATFPSATSYLWSTNAVTPSIYIASSGLYSVNINVGSCTLIDTVEVLDPIPLVVSLGNDVTLCENTNVTLDAGNLGEDYLWSTGSHASSIVVNTSGTYWVKVTSATCNQSSEDTVVVIMNNPNQDDIIVPNIISPNGDQLNDFISLSSSSEITWDIFNRWGQSVFKGSGKNLIWHARFNEVLLDAGVYFYILKYTPVICVEHESEVTSHGFITVIR